MAENLAEMGVSVTIVQRPKQLLAPLDADMASFVHAEMRRHGIVLRLGETVTGFRQDGDSVLTLLESSEPLSSDMVLLAIGVTPDTHLAKEAGLELGIRGSIAVNERMETSVPDIYAVGDAVEVTHFVTGQKALISLAGPANKQGRIAADNICGGTPKLGTEVGPVFPPRLCDFGVFIVPVLCEGLQIVQSSLLVHCSMVSLNLPPAPLRKGNIQALDLHHSIGLSATPSSL